MIYHKAWAKDDCGHKYSNNPFLSPLCSVLRWETGRRPSRSTSFLPRTLMATRYRWRNTGKLCSLRGGTIVFRDSSLSWCTAFWKNSKVECCWYIQPKLSHGSWLEIKLSCHFANLCHSLASLFFYVRGYVCIIVNVASKWGKTRVNYTQLAGMHASYAEKGLRILGFPCNQFGGQVTTNKSWCMYLEPFWPVW